MVYGIGGEILDYKVRCEVCGKWVEQGKRIDVYGPDTVDWGGEPRPRLHWFCGGACVEENDKRNKQNRETL